jgi:hypothetical protein
MIMTSNNILLLGLAIFAASAVPLDGRAVQTIGAISESDANAVYAAALQNERKLDFPAAPEIAIFEETRGPQMEILGDSSIPPEWRSTLTNYTKENARVRRIQAGADLGMRYSIVTWAELRKRMQQAGYLAKSAPITNAPGWRVFSAFPGGRILSFSAVGFNLERTRATLTVQYDCFPSEEPLTESACHSGRQYFMEKKDGRWMLANNVPSKTWIA